MRLFLLSVATYLAFLPLQGVQEDSLIISSEIESSIEMKSFNHCPAYISSYSTGAAVLSNPGVFDGVLFPNNQSTPKGIIHPLNGDSSLFKIHKSGVYQINWAITLSNFDDPSDTAEIQLTANSVVIAPAQLISGFNNPINLPTTRIPVSGSVIIPLEKDTILQLQIAHNSGTLGIEAGMFSVLKVN